MKRILRSLIMAFAFLIPLILSTFLPPVSADTQDYFPGTETAVKGTVGGAAFPGAIETSDDSYRTPQEADQASTTDLTTDSETLTKANSVSGALSDLNTDNAVSRVVSEADQGGTPTDLIPDTETINKGSGVSGSFPGDIDDDNGVSRVYREANQAGAEALAYDAAVESVRTATTDPWTWDHVPVGDPRGIVVTAAHATANTDFIVSVTYGGVPMTRVISAADTDGGESGRSYIYFLGSSIPTGTRQVLVDLTSATANDIQFVSVSYTANSDTEVLDSDLVENDVVDPSVTLQFGGRQGLAIMAYHSGISTIPRPTACSGSSATCTLVFNEDWGNQVASVDRQTTRGAVDQVMGYTTVLDDVALSVVAIASSADYELQVTYDHTGPESCSGTRTLTVNAWRASGATMENVEVYVATSAEAFTTLAFTVTATADGTTYTYVLTADEWDSGLPNYRFIDTMTSGDTSQGDINIDYAVIVCVVLDFELEYRNAFTGETCAATRVLTVNAWRSTGGMENVEAQVEDGSDTGTYVARITVSQTTDTATQTYTLTDPEWDAGDVQIRMLGTSESGDTSQGEFSMDYVVIQCIPAADFESEVKYDWFSVDTSGNSWTLWVECKRVTNPEDYLVQVVDSTEASWVTRYTCDQNSDTSYSSYQLTVDELDGGSPNVRFLGASESGDGSQSTWDIDLLKIVREFTSNAVPTLTLNYANPYTITRDQSVDFGTTYTDADDEAPTYIKVTLSPAGTNRTLDENNTGDTTYTDGKAYHLTDAANTYCPSSQTFFFSTSDGQAGHAIRSGSQTLTISNTAPAITNGGSAPVTVIHGNDYSFDFDASDVDVPVCQSFTWTKPVGPAWLVIDGGTGVLSGTAPDDTGGNAVTVRVSDGTATNDFPFTLTVTNAAPTWTANSPSSTVHHGDPYSYDFNAADTDPLDYIYFSKDAGPGWLGINAATGVYSGTAPHTLASGGSNTVTVHDQAIPNGTASHIWTVTITNENPAFTSGEQGSESAQNDTLYTHDYNAADASGDYLYFTLATNNTDIQIGPLNGTVWGHLTSLGIFYVNVTVHDDANPNGTDWNNYTLTVSLQPPEIGGGDSGGAIGAGAILAILLAIAIGIGFGLPIARRKKKTRGFKASRRAGVTSKRGGISAPKRGFRMRRRLGGS